MSADPRADPRADGAVIAGEVGARIRSARTAAGLSQGDLAERLGVSQAAVSSWERGEGLGVTVAGLLEVAHALGIDPGALLPVGRTAAGRSPETRASDGALLEHWRGLDNLTPAVRELLDLAERMYRGHTSQQPEPAETLPALAEAERAAAELFAPECVHEGGEACTECDGRARRFVGAIAPAILAACPDCATSEAALLGVEAVVNVVRSGRSPFATPMLEKGSLSWEVAEAISRGRHRGLAGHPSAPTHFAAYGDTAAACGESIPKRTSWKAERGDWDSPGLTTRRAEATCPACIAALAPGPDAGLTEASTGAPPADGDAPLRCPNCGSISHVSISLDGGWTRRAQCVPCGRVHAHLGAGWRAPSRAPEGAREAVEDA